jgi:hypothetical protein
MHICINDFEDYAKEFLCPNCKLIMLKDDKCWEICVRTWLNGMMKDANGCSK